MKVEAEKTFLLFVWGTSSPDQAISILKKITRSQAQAVCEIVTNFLNGTLDITDRIKRKFTPYKTFLRRLKSKRISLKRKISAIISKSVVIYRLLQMLSSYVQPYLVQ